MKKGVRDNINAYSFILPFAFIYMVFLFLPFIYSIYLSFNQVTDFSDVFGGLSFVGLKNYLFLFRDKEFWWALVVTLYYALIIIPLNIVVSLLLAILLRKRYRLNSMYRTFFFLPFVLDAFVVGIVWTFIYAGRYGLLVNILKPLIGSIYETGFLGNAKTVMPSVALAMTLKGAGFGMILYIAALDGIPKEVYEAAELDGATGLKKLWYITLPLIQPVTTFMVIIGIIGALSAFAEFYAMTGGGPIVYKWGTPLGMTKVTGLYLFNHFSNLRLGLAAATSFVLLVLALGLSITYSKIQRKR